MKYLFISALLSVCTVQAWAQQEKKEATVKIVINENGKEKVIERKFSDIEQADKEIKKLSDSLDINISTSGGKNKIVRVDVNKSLGKTIVGPDGPQGPGQRRVRILRNGNAPKDIMIFKSDKGKDGEIVLEDIKGGPGESLDIQIEGPNGPRMLGGPMQFRGRFAPGMNGRMGAQMNEFRKKRKDFMEKQKQQASKTVKGLFAYPNKPFNGKLNIRFDAPEKGNVSIAVMDVNGKEIATEQLKDFQGVYLGQIDLKKSGPGVYFIRVSQGNDGAVRRVKID
jgi:hypothetical protein